MKKTECFEIFGTGQALDIGMASYDNTSCTLGTYQLAFEPHLPINGVTMFLNPNISLKRPFSVLDTTYESGNTFNNSCSSWPSIISNMINKFDDEVIDCWYAAAKNDILTKARMELYERTDKASSELIEITKAFKNNEITLEVFGTLYIRILGKFAVHKEDESRLVGEWLFYNTPEEGDTKVDCAYQSFNKLSQAMNEALEIPMLKGFITMRLGKESIVPVNWKLNPRPYNKLIIMVVKAIFHDRKESTISKYPQIYEIVKLIDAKLDIESSISMGEISKNYRAFFKNIIIDNLNEGKVTLKAINSKFDLNKFVYFLNDNCNKIKNLNLDETDFIIDRLTIKNFPHLETFSLKGCKIVYVDNVINELEKRSLTSLDMTYCKRYITKNKSSFPITELKIEKLTSLKSLNISELRSLNDLNFLHKLTNLEKLNLASISKPNILLNLGFLEKCTKIRDLNLKGCNTQGLNRTPFNMFFKEGKCTDSNGEIYEGSFKNGELDGPGSHITPICKLVGNFVNGELHCGKRFDNKSNFYEGELYKGTPHGKGKLCNPHGGIFEGNFVRGKMEGHFIITSSQNVKNFEGNMSNGKYNGQGTIYYLNGNKKYVGNFVDNMKNGQGIDFDINGNKFYEGTFLNGKPHGQGIMHYIGGEMLKGDFCSSSFFSDTNAFYCFGKLISLKGETPLSKFKLNGNELPTLVDKLL